MSYLFYHTTWCLYAASLTELALTFADKVNGVFPVSSSRQHYGIVSLQKRQGKKSAWPEFFLSQVNPFLITDMT